MRLVIEGLVVIVLATCAHSLTQDKPTPKARAAALEFGMTEAREALPREEPEPREEATEKPEADEGAPIMLGREALYDDGLMHQPVYVHEKVEVTDHFRVDEFGEDEDGNTWRLPDMEVSVNVKVPIGELRLGR